MQEPSYHSLEFINQRSLGHECRFVHTADHNTGVNWPGPDYLLCVHTHQVTKEHTGGMRESFMQADSGKFNDYTTLEMTSPFSCVHELVCIAMARIEAGACINDSNN